MSRPSVLLCAALVVVAGCRLPERETLRALPENGPGYRYAELIARARSQATIALEAFYVDNWLDLEDASASLEQTARFLAKGSEIPAVLQDRVGPEADQLRRDAIKLGEASRKRDARAVNETLQRINLRIRELRIDQGPPPPAPAPPAVPPPAKT